LPDPVAPPHRPVIAAVLAAMLALSVAACGGGSKVDDSKPIAAASFYPIAEATQRVGADCFTVLNMTPDGMSPHGAEPTADTIAALQDAAVAFYLGGAFQPQVEQAISELPSGTPVIDLLEVGTLRTIDDPVSGVIGEVDGEVLEGGRDPHMWVDPVLFAQMVEGIRDGLIAAAPSCADQITENTASYLGELEQLDADFRTALATCTTRTLVTSHAAFGYLADQYNLKQAPIAGISPDEEPNAQSIKAVAALAKADGVKTVFFEELVPPDLAEVVAAEIGAQTDALDPVEGIPAEALADGDSYDAIQRRNLAALVKGLGCTA
jgi:zinc transport system substrate-binding protein